MPHVVMMANGGLQTSHGTNFSPFSRLHCEKWPYRNHIWLSSIGLLIWMSSFWSAVQFLSVHIHEFASFGSGDLFWPFPSVWLARTPYIVAVCGLLEEQIVDRRGLGILKIYGPLITACCDFWLCSFRSVFTGFLQAIHSCICFFLAFCICNFKDC